MSAQKLILLFVLPFIFYVIPIADIQFIPEIKKEYIFITFNVMVAAFYLTILLTDLHKLKTQTRKIIITATFLLFFFAHFILFMYIDIAYNGIQSSKQIIQTKLQSAEPTVYIIEQVGFLDFHSASVIGYSKKYSPFLNVYYKTKKHLKLITENANEVIIEEYSYERPAGEGKVFIPRSAFVRRQIKIIRINRSHLK